MAKRSRPNNDDNVIDSRDVIAAITALESEIADFDGDSDDLGDLERELVNLKALADEAESCGDWRHGATLIADSYFEDYARQLAEDICGEAVRNAQWPCNCIDWDKAASALQHDYTSVDFNGETYWEGTDRWTR